MICRRWGRLTVGAQGRCQHLNTLVSDGLPGAEVRGQQTPGGCGAGRGGGGFGRVGFGLPGIEKQGVCAFFFFSSLRGAVGAESGGGESRCPQGHGQWT